MIEKITVDQLPFTFEMLNMMKKDGLTIERLKGEFSDYFYFTSSRIHRVYSFNGESPILLTEIHLYDLFHALSNDSFKEKVLNHIGTAQTI